MVNIDNAWIFMFNCIDKLFSFLEVFWVFIYFVKLSISLLEKEKHILWDKQNFPGLHSFLLGSI